MAKDREHGPAQTAHAPYGIGYRSLKTSAARPRVSAGAIGLATLLLAIFASVAAAKVPADVVRAEDRFETVGAKERLAEVLAKVDASNARQLIGHARWDALVQERAPGILASPDHATFAARLNDMIHETGQSHFHYMTDRDWGYWHARSAFRRSATSVAVAHIGLFPERIEGKWFARGVFEGSPAEAAGVRVGDELVSVDGKPYAPIHAFTGREDANVTLRVRRKPGLLLNLVVAPKKQRIFTAMQRAIIDSIDVRAHDGVTYAFAHLWTTLGKGREYRKLLQLQEEVDALLLDMRDGYGGYWQTAIDFLLDDAPEGWEKPVVILTAEGTRSAKEIIVNRARDAGRATLVGTPTPGAVTSVGAIERVGDDAVLMTPGKRFHLEGNPTVPDLLIERQLPYSAGRDPQMQAALDILAAKVRERREAPPFKPAEPEGKTQVPAP